MAGNSSEQKSNSSAMWISGVLIVGYGFYRVLHHANGTHGGSSSALFALLRILLAFGIVVACIAAGIFILTLIQLRSFAKRMPENLGFRIIDPLQEFPNADHGVIAVATESLLSLGFEKMVDYTVDLSQATPISGFGQVFAHQAHRCYAETNQIMKSAGDMTQVHSVIISLMSDGWVLSTTNRKTSGESYAQRRPRAIWTSIPGATPRDLLQQHLAMRERMVADLGLTVQGPITTENYFVYEQEAHRQRRTLLLKKNPLMFVIEVWLFAMKPKTEWLGEYAKRVPAARTKQPTV